MYRLSAFLAAVQPVDLRCASAATKPTYIFIYIFMYKYCEKKMVDSLRFVPKHAHASKRLVVETHRPRCQVRFPQMALNIPQLSCHRKKHDQATKVIENDLLSTGQDTYRISICRSRPAAGVCPAQLHPQLFERTARALDTLSPVVALSTRVISRFVMSSSSPWCRWICKVSIA